jgi:copper chaperone
MEVGMIVFKVPNMSCGGCARAVQAALRAVAPGAEVQVDLRRREVSVAGAPDADGLARALRDAGFAGERLDA